MALRKVSAAVAQWSRYRIVAGLITSSSPVPLKTRRVGERCTLNLSRAQTEIRLNFSSLQPGYHNTNIEWDSDMALSEEDNFSEFGGLFDYMRVTAEACGYGHKLATVRALRHRKPTVLKRLVYFKSLEAQNSLWRCVVVWRGDASSSVGLVT
ncbi:hypothetical protein TNCV_4582411 [Trichonephila clavipes]|nr:hypothetical protein TNCV_4582411 [Trichonephila clavipes]